MEHKSSVFMFASDEKRIFFVLKSMKNEKVYVEKRNFFDKWSVIKQIIIKFARFKYHIIRKGTFATKCKIDYGKPIIRINRLSRIT